MYRQGVFYTLAATGYLYSLIIVDTYRKLVGTNVESIRNFVYIFFFALLMVDMYRSKHLPKMLTICGVTMFLFEFSILLNPGHSAVYSSSIMLFFSRLWPAYYIGRYTDNWNSLCKSILYFSPIALVYAVSLFVLPDLAGGQAYATIASNLAFVSMISLFSCLYYKKIIFIPIVITCLIPVFFYGTRAFFLGVIISLLLTYIINGNNVSKSKRLLLATLGVSVFFIFYVAGDVIFNQLYRWFPESRTLQKMALGDFMDDSNRSSYYIRLINHLTENPFDMRGFIGDRIFLAGTTASTETILATFSHNCMLELCINFGLPLGIILNVFFLTQIIKSLRYSFYVQNTINYVYVLVLGAGFVDMMISASYMGSYIPWFLFGLAFCINSKIKASMCLNN